MFNDYSYLYVEDDQLSREILRMIMENVMEVTALTIFEDSHNFSNKLQHLPDAPNVFLLDIHVKPVDGFEMLRVLRSDPAYSNAKIIAVTASVMNEEITKLRESGFDGAIAKPLSIQTFPTSMQRILQGESVWHIT